MKDYTNFDDLNLYLSCIKSISVDYSHRTITMFFAKPFDLQAKKLKYVESKLILHDIRIMDFQQNFDEAEVPEFYRSALLTKHNNYKLKEGEKVYFFGIDWGCEYFHWHLVAKYHEIIEASQPLDLSELIWV